jgi:hypothetical protein
LSEFPQELISGAVAAGFVDRFETVDVYMQQGMGNRLCLGMPDGPFDPGLELAAIDEAGKLVM